MSLYALENLDEAMEETKDLLLPFDFMTWTKIAIIALLASGVSIPNLPAGAPAGGPGDQVYTPDSDFENTPDVASGIGDISMTGLSTAGITDAVAVAILVLGALFAGFFLYISSIFQFIYFQTVLDKEPSIVENIRKHAYRGLRYLGFQIGIVILALAALIVPAALWGTSQFMALVALVVFWVPFAVVLAVIMGLVHDLVLLRMIEEKEGLIEAAKNVWPDIKTEWRQVIAFLFVKFFISLAIGVALAMVIIAVVITLLIPFGIAGILAGLVHPALSLLALIAGALTFTIIMFYLRMPFSAYIYTYVTLFYHDLTS
jgi:MFS family permease